jgi:hypothetical protein
MGLDMASVRHQSSPPVRWGVHAAASMARAALRSPSIIITSSSRCWIQRTRKRCRSELLIPISLLLSSRFPLYHPSSIARPHSVVGGRPWRRVEFIARTAGQTVDGSAAMPTRLPLPLAKAAAAEARQPAICPACPIQSSAALMPAVMTSYYKWRGWALVPPVTSSSSICVWSFLSPTEATAFLRQFQCAQNGTRTATRTFCSHARGDRTTPPTPLPPFIYIASI